VDAAIRAQARLMDMTHNTPSTPRGAPTGDTVSKALIYSRRS